MKWSSAKKNKTIPEMEESDLVAEISKLSLQPNSPTIPPSPDAPILSPKEALLIQDTNLETNPIINTDPTLPLDLSTASPPPYSPHLTSSSTIISISSTTSTSPTSPTPSTSPTPTRPNPLTKRLTSIKSALDDGRATSFAKAACSGGLRAQKSFFKAEAVTQAVKTGNVPIVAINAVRAAYKGGKEARVTFKEAERVRVERLERERWVGEGSGSEGESGSESESGSEGEKEVIKGKGKKGKEGEKGKDEKKGKKGGWFGKKEVM